MKLEFIPTAWKAVMLTTNTIPAYMELVDGIEPPTYSLQVNCTSIVLYQHLNSIKNRVV